MLHALNLEEFEAGVRFWDSPMQNILYADVAGNIAIRSAGFLPIRRDGTGEGVADGSRGGSVWLGRVPFEELPYARNPEQGYLASANQEPAGAWYPHYVGHDWRRTYRALRINELMRGKDQHSVQDLMDYQADVLAVQGREFARLLRDVRCPDEGAEEVRSQLAAWNGTTTREDRTTRVFDAWMSSLSELTWDEPPFSVMRPYTAQLYRLLTGAISDKWVDQTETEGREEVSDLLCASLAIVGAGLDSDGPTAWGEDHTIMFYHLLQSGALSALSRGPFPFPGYSETLSPGGGRMVTHTASWRMVVDLSTIPPSGYGVYPGGASGNPLDDGYDDYLSAYLQFSHFVLENPQNPEHFADRPDITRLTLNPAG
jgi:penicillin amidase